jgi:hypothetical protein
MYTRNKAQATTLKVNKTYQGERLEEKIQRIVNNKEPITDGAPIIYTERKEGVQPEHNIRTDRFEIAIDAMDAVSKTYKAKRHMQIGERTYDTMTPEQQTAFNKEFPMNKHNKKTEGKP